MILRNNFNLAKPQLNGDVVDSGDLVKGWLTFEIPEDLNIKSLKLRYEYNGLMAKHFKSGWVYLSAVKY
jgi:hypothetical protein